MTRYASSMSQISRPFLPAAPPPTYPAPRYLALRQKLRLASDKCWHPRVDQDALGRALVLAARDGDAESSSRLLRANPALDAHEHEGETALVAASVGGHVRAVIALLDAGARPDRATRTGNTALRAAVVLGDGECVAALLRGGATVDLETARGTPLVAACARGDTEAARQLVAGGANVNFETRAAQTPLLAAVREDHLETIEALLTAGADPARVNADGVSPIDLAESLGRGGAHAALVQREVGKAADAALEESAGRLEKAAAARDAWHERSLRDLNERLERLREERVGKVDALRAENDELRRKFGLR